MSTGRWSWVHGSFHVLPRTTIGAATEKSDAFCRCAGTGALETEQQEPFGAAATLAVVSSMLIWSHWD